MAAFQKSLHLRAPGCQTYRWGKLQQGVQYVSIRDLAGVEVIPIFFMTGLSGIVEFRDALNARITEIEAAKLNEHGETPDEEQERLDTDLHDHCEAE